MGITLTTGWHFFGFENEWSASGSNHTLIRYDTQTQSYDNQAWLGMQTPTGDLQVGCSLNGSFWLDGKVATVWTAGYMPASVGDSLREYWNLTQGIFWA
jgi:hypothetical protein